MEHGLLSSDDPSEHSEDAAAASSVESSQDRRQRRTRAIQQLLAEFAPSPNHDLLAQMIVTICRLAADGADRGDLKILNTALKELRYAFKVFAPFGEIPKVTIFGSARTPQGHPQYEEARKFADLIQAQGWMVITGAGDGIMRAGHHGATRQKSFGVAISLPFEQITNAFIEDDPKLVNFKYFFTRKLMFIKEAEAIVLFPGGFGTQDEGFEALTLVQTAKTSPLPIVLCEAPGGTYWKHWDTYVKKELLDNAMIDPADLGLFRICDRAEDAVQELLRFYRRYHSMRYVEDRLVLRLNKPLGPETLSQINAQFADILSDGRMEQSLGPVEGEDGLYSDKARLVLAFDRRSTGRLRSLIDAINEAP
jgi:hypothetical protein